MIRKLIIIHLSIATATGENLPFFTTDFVNGLSEDPIEDYKVSFNTKTNYYHYRLVFPDDQMSLRISGNYIIKVYTAGNPDKPAMTKRFMISEESSSITSNVLRPPAILV